MCCGRCSGKFAQKMMPMWGCVQRWLRRSDPGPGELPQRLPVPAVGHAGRDGGPGDQTFRCWALTRNSDLLSVHNGRRAVVSSPEQQTRPMAKRCLLALPATEGRLSQVVTVVLADDSSLNQPLVAQPRRYDRDLRLAMMPA